MPHPLAALLKPASHPRPRSRGFTLLEILVVLVIISTIISFATLSLNRADDSLKEETERLAALIRLASEEAVFKGRELALEFRDDGYSFLTLEEEKWIPLADDESEDILRPRTLPEGIGLELSTEGEAAKLSGKEEENGSDARVYLLSSGEMTPFRVLLRKKNGTESYELRANPLGKIESGSQLSDGK